MDLARLIETMKSAARSAYELGAADAFDALAKQLRQLAQPVTDLETREVLLESARRSEESSRHYRQRAFVHRPGEADRTTPDLGELEPVKGLAPASEARPDDTSLLEEIRKRLDDLGGAPRWARLASLRTAPAIRIEDVRLLLVAIRETQTGAPPAVDSKALPIAELEAMLSMLGNRPDPRRTQRFLDDLRARLRTA